jgi:hypothetical protein
MKRAREHQRTPTHDAFPLRTVAAMTGLTADLIRAWEKRYAVVAPIRGARGARLYSAADIAHLRLLARVVGADRRRTGREPRANERSCRERTLSRGCWSGWSASTMRR